MEWNGVPVTPRGVGLSIEPTDATERRWVLKLGMATPDGCVLEPDPAAFQHEGRRSTRVWMLDQWIAHLERLRVSGGGVTHSDLERGIVDCVEIHLPNGRHIFVDSLHGLGNPGAWMRAYEEQAPFPFERHVWSPPAGAG